MSRIALDKLESAVQTAREYDENGWFVIRDNPISKVGVFPYLGRSISDELEPDKIYMVLRPEEVLSDPEVLRSFQLVPFIDEHEMLGDGHTAAEAKGVGGVIGENVYFKGDTIYANLRVFSERLAGEIANGKRELSAGYRCRYELTPGVWRGQKYDAIQVDLRGNHLALVDQGRMGPDVAVLDHMKITLDAKDVATMSKKLKLRKALDQLDEQSKAIRAALDAEEGSETESEDADEEGTTSEDEGTEEEATDEGTEEAEDEGTEEEATDEGEEPKGMDAALKAIGKMAKGMDALSKRVDALTKRKGLDTSDVFEAVAKRDNLVERLRPIIGVFDHAKMTHDGVAKYAVKKLGLACDSGAEVATLNGFLAASAKKAPVVAADRKPGAADFLKDFIS